MTSRVSIQHFWLKSECLGPIQSAQAKSILQELTNDDEPIINPASSLALHSKIHDPPIVDRRTARDILSSLNSLRFLEVPLTLLHELLDDVDDVQNENVLMHILNSPAPLGEDAFREEVSNEQLASLFQDSLQVSIANEQ